MVLWVKPKNRRKVVKLLTHGILYSATFVYLENQKQYELTNHLGNVLVTVSDKKIPVDTNADGIADYYVPSIVSAQDYYPYGMVQPEREYAILGDSAYRFGFNGKLYDNELYGSKNSYDYGMRFYDPRLGRFMSVDPLTKKYPESSPYVYAGNNPIYYVDREGKDFVVYINNYNHTITICATYYTVRNDAFAYQSAAAAAEFWNRQSGLFEYDVDAGSNQIAYTVNFDIKVIPVDNPVVEKGWDRLNVIDALTPNNSSNIFIVEDDNAPDFDADRDGDIPEGVTNYGNKVAIKKSLIENQREVAIVSAHEIGHTLGLSHT